MAPLTTFRAGVKLP